MSAEAVGWAWRQQGLSVHAKIVLLRLCEFANHDNECWPSQARVAADCCIPRETVNRTIKQLVAARLIENRAQTQNGAKLVSRYFIRCDAGSLPHVTLDHIPHVTGDHINNLLLEDTLEPSGSNGASAPPLDPVKELWHRGLAVLGGNRSVFGKMRKQWGDATVLAAVVACEDERPSDPVPYFIRACEARGRDAPSNYHQTPLGNLFEGAKRAADAFNARQSLRNLGDREPVALPLLDSGGTRRDPAGTA